MDIYPVLGSLKSINDTSSSKSKHKIKKRREKKENSRNLESSGSKGLGLGSLDKSTLYSSVSPSTFNSRNRILSTVISSRENLGSHGKCTSVLSDADSLVISYNYNIIPTIS
eukprot:Tbor_TRINITY_DN4846_c0_g2::TRINITY_DN4846_c0_g2_i1::g.1373::m.1373